MESLTALPWHWVIETLAEVEQVDTFLLQALISKIPDFWTDAFDNVRERIALRYLEECARFDLADPPSTSDCRSGIGTTRRSEEVLCYHLRRNGYECRQLEGGAKNMGTDFDYAATAAHREFERGDEKVENLDSLVMDGTEFSIHELHQFVLHKRTALPKSSLGLLKELILEGRCPIASSLLGPSGLLTSDQVDYLQHTIGGECQLENTPKTFTSNHQISSGIQGSVALAPNSGNANLQKEPFESVKHLPEENISDIATRNHPNGNIISTKGSDDLLVEKDSTLNKAVPALNREDHESSPPPPLPPHVENPLSGTKKVVNDPLCKGDHFDIDQSVIPETPTEDGGLDDAHTNFDPNHEMFISEKHQMISSQIHANPDSIGDWSQQGSCIKCNEGGQLLKCSGQGCLIAVHESCVGSSADFDDESCLFYCPFCAYTRANIAYRKARKDVFQARQALSVFIGRNPVIPGETSQAGPSNTKEHHEIGDVNVCPAADLPSRYPEACPSFDIPGGSHDEADVNPDEMVNTNLDNNKVLQSLNNGDSTMDHGNLPCGNKVTSPTCEKNDNDILHHEGVGAVSSDASRAQEKHGLGSVSDCADAERLENQEEVRTAPDQDTREEASTLNPRKRNSRKRDHAKVAPSESPAKRKRHDAEAVDKISDPHENVENPKKGKFSSGSRSRRGPQTKHFFNQPVRLGRRQKLFWTSEEEETLKDGMQRYGIDSDGNYPWTKILEFGRHIFHKTRQPGDLKDKWRNIKKKEVKQET